MRKMESEELEKLLKERKIGGLILLQGFIFG